MSTVTRMETVRGGEAWKYGPVVRNGILGTMLCILVGAGLGAGLGAAAGAFLLGVLLGSLASAGLGGVLTLLDVRKVRAQRCTPDVGERVVAFTALDEAFTRLEARREENPDLVGGVLGGVRQARGDLVRACVEYERVKDELDPSEYDSLDSLISAEFQSAHALIAECGDSLDLQKRLSRRSELKAAGVASLLGSGSLTRLRDDLSARRTALGELEGIGA